MNNKRKIVVAVTGASGSIYARLLLDKLTAIKEQAPEIAVVMSDNAKAVWKHELGDDNYKTYSVRFFDKNDFHAPFASGSAKYDTMIVCPCSMGTMARIASGISNDLVTRAADVILKERRRLVLAIRDTPYSLIHINNMKTITEAGGIICPASPSFYSNPQNFDQLAATVVDRMLDLCQIDVQTFRWNDTP